ncbi:MAG TPA: leucyl aminopeptidase [Mycobacteriales bacterium]|nr:leucyl aminopeptidase [Mycobacteriales bacterium]
MTRVSVLTTDPAGAKADAIVVATVPAPSAGRSGEHRRRAAAAVLAAGAETVDAALGGQLTQALTDLGATGRRGELHRVTTLGATTAPVVLAVGLGPDGATPRRVRAAAAVATRALKGARTAVFALPADTPELVAAQAEGAITGGYDFVEFRGRSREGRKTAVGRVQVAIADGGDRNARAALRRAVARGTAIADALTFARDLVNAPPRDLPPTALADRACSAAEAVGVSTQVLDEHALADGGYGGLAGVGQGSTRPPRLVALRWNPPAASAHVALVGKGITFDSGGLSLKPPTSMETMKDDMAGAAAVAATVVAAARLQLPVAITGWLCCAENMPSGAAIRPGDVLTMYSGTRVEVLNTDAEGRLVLADGLHRAGEDAPDAIVDIATLTGAASVALGSKIAGLMANDDAFRDRVRDAADIAGEDVWPMPLPADLRERLDSAVADIANVPPSGGRDAGMLTAGLFLSEFVPDGIPWAHLDIAGPAWNSGETSGDTTKGGTGFGVRTLLALVESYCD